MSINGEYKVNSIPQRIFGVSEISLQMIMSTIIKDSFEVFKAEPCTSPGPTISSSCTRLLAVPHEVLGIGDPSDNRILTLIHFYLATRVPLDPR